MWICYETSFIGYRFTTENLGPLISMHHACICHETQHFRGTMVYFGKPNIDLAYVTRPTLLVGPQFIYENLGPSNVIK